MEKARGISISSAALQFALRRTVVNLVDTPGHADFSEDTYRVLAAVDSAVMLLDAAKGLEPQTMKLFDVCRHRGIPVITVVNKWDRPGPRGAAAHGRDPRPHRPGADAAHLAGRHRRRLPRRARAQHRRLRPLHPHRGRRDRRARGARRPGAGGRRARATPGRPRSRRASCSRPWARCTTRRPSSPAAPRPCCSARRCSTSACGSCSTCCSQLAPRARRRARTPRASRATSTPRSARSCSRSRPAWTPSTATGWRTSASAPASSSAARSSRTPSTGKPFATKYAQQVFGRDRETVDLAYPGDVVGLVNATALRVGDSLYVEEPVTYPEIPSFAPEHFAVCRAEDSGRYKQFRRGIEQLEQEGTVQVLRSDLRGDQAPVLAAVGPMQFEVAQHRLARRVRRAGAAGPAAVLPGPAHRPGHGAKALIGQSGVEVLERGDGALLALFADPWRLCRVQRDLPTPTSSRWWPPAQRPDGVGAAHDPRTHARHGPRRRQGQPPRGPHRAPRQARRAVRRPPPARRRRRCRTACTRASRTCGCRCSTTRSRSASTWPTAGPGTSTATRAGCSCCTRAQGDGREGWASGTADGLWRNADLDPRSTTPRCWWW